MAVRGWCIQGERTRKIDDPKLHRLVAQHASSLVLYARQWCLHPDDAAQEAFFDLSRMAELPADPVAWLYKTTRYKALNQSRSEGRRVRHQRMAGNTQEWFVPDPTANLQAAELVQALEQLPAQQREIVTARVWGELSFAQIAELVSLPTTTTFRIYQQTLQLLQEQLEGRPATKSISSSIFPKSQS
jgi:RNA polymerase sigma-70 factor (ECF subfamily)